MDIDKELMELRTFRNTYEPLLKEIATEKRRYDERNAAREAAIKAEDEAAERERSDAITQKCKDDATEAHEALLKAEEERLAGKGKSEAPAVEIESDDDYRARLVAVALVDDKPAIGVATGADLDKIGAALKLARAGATTTPAPAA